MIPQVLIKLILPKIIDHMMKIFKLDKVLSYVEQDNELDYKVKAIEKRLEKLES
jgi:hypothetical protein